MDTLYVVMPAYNEQDNIEEVVSSWYSVLEGKSPESRVVVADSGSTDNTHAILEKMKRLILSLRSFQTPANSMARKLSRSIHMPSRMVLIISSRQTLTDRRFLKSLTLSGSSATDTRESSDTVS